MKERFDVTGMTCAACSLAVEKSVKKIDGVKEVNVSLLTNSMNVEMEDGLELDAIVDAVEKAGYGAKLKGKADAKTSHSPSQIIGQEIKDLALRLKISIPFMLILMYVAMGEMVGLPYPSFLSGPENSGIMIFTQLLLTLPIIYVNRAYFINGFKALRNLGPNMDSLVALGSSAGLIYGIFSTYMINYGLGHNNMEMVHHYMHDIYFESAAMILTLITLGKYLEARSKQKTTDSINKLIEIQPDSVRVIRGKIEEEIAIDDVMLGDHIRIIPGERIAIDGRIIEGTSSVDQSAITGESIPIAVEKDDQVISGSINMNGSFIMEANKVGQDTTINKIIQLIEEASASKAPISKLADKISSIFVPVVIGLAILSFIVWMILGEGFEFAFSIAVGVLVISCPCALGLATPVAMMVATGKAADNGIIVKSSEGLEQVHRTNTMIFDKTGTITKGKPVITDIISLSGKSEDDIISLAYSLEAMSQQPLASAIANYAKEKNIALLKTEDFESMTGKGVKALIAGKNYYIGNDKLMKDVGINPEKFQEIADIYSKEGKTSIYLFSKEEVISIISVADQIKESSLVAINKIKEMGIKTVMLTGDHTLTAKAMAEKSGVDEFRAELLPQDKDKIVSEYQKSGIVTMVGDGINDAPALIRADVGIGIAEGTDVAIDSADLVLMKSDLNDIVTALNLSKKTIINIKQNLFWAFIYNVLAIPIAMGLLYYPLGIKLNPMIGAAAMSLSSVFVVTNALRLKNFKPEFKEIKLTEQVYSKVNYEIKNINNEIKEKEYMKKELIVEGMTCNHCKMRVENAVKAVEGVEDAQVILDEKKLVYEAETDLDDKVREVVTEAGYKVVA